MIYTCKSALKDNLQTVSSLPPLLSLRTQSAHTAQISLKSRRIEFTIHSRNLQRLHVHVQRDDTLDLKLIAPYTACIPPPADLVARRKHIQSLYDGQRRRLELRGDEDRFRRVSGLAELRKHEQKSLSATRFGGWSFYRTSKGNRLRIEHIHIIRDGARFCDIQLVLTRSELNQTPLQRRNLIRSSLPCC